MADKNISDDRLPEALIDELKRRDAAPEVITSRVDRTLAAGAHTLQRATGGVASSRRLGGRGGKRRARRRAHDQLSPGP